MSWEEAQLRSWSCCCTVDQTLIQKDGQRPQSKNLSGNRYRRLLTFIFSLFYKPDKPCFSCKLSSYDFWLTINTILDNLESITNKSETSRRTGTVALYLWNHPSCALEIFRNVQPDILKIICKTLLLLTPQNINPLDSKDCLLKEITPGWLWQHPKHLSLNVITCQVDHIQSVHIVSLNYRANVEWH